MAAEVGKAGEEGAGAGAGAKQRFNLKAGCELRLEVGKPEDGGVAVTLLSGACEVFGAEVAAGQRLALGPGQKLAFFTYFGAQLEVEGQPEVLYEADETPMTSYANTHAVLEARRKAAAQAKAPGPRVMVVGPTDVGKTTLCKILTNYAVRMGWAPLVADLDIGQGMITVPGTIAATPVENIITPETEVPQDIPLAFWYGHASAQENQQLYKRLVKRMAELLDSYQASSPEGKVQSAGMFINTMGFVEGLGYKLLQHSIKTLKVDVVLVIGHERLYSQISSELKQEKHISVVKLAKSGGVVQRETPVRKADRDLRVKKYFYGVAGDLSPVSNSIPFDAVELFRVGGGPKAPTSALPIGASSASDPLRLAKVAPGRDLVNSLLAVSHADKPEGLVAANVAGFIHVNDVDMANRVIKYTAPCPGPLPSKFLMLGTVKCWLS